MIVNGLLANSHVEFFQYPPLPLTYRSKIHNEELWHDLHRNLIKDPLDLARKLQGGFFDLAIISDKNGWLFEYGKQSSLQKLRRLIGLFLSIKTHGISTVIAKYGYLSSLKFSLKELNRFVPVVAVDLNDSPNLKSGDAGILQECSLYFKREVPYNRFALYHPFRSKKYRTDETLTLLSKVHNIPLGIVDGKFDELKKLRVKEQDIDVFWVGQNSSTIRVTASKLLEELSGKGRWNIFIPEEPLSFEEFCQVAARSKISISVEGDGWDCYRHYEAVALGSLPLINRPSFDAVWWHKMPEEIYFENNFSNFISRIEQMLEMSELRKKCLYDMEEFIEKHMLWSKIIEYIIQTSRNIRNIKEERL